MDGVKMIHADLVNHAATRSMSVTRCYNSYRPLAFHSRSEHLAQTHLKRGLFGKVICPHRAHVYRVAGGTPRPVITLNLPPSMQ